jgi:hypothetical protein
MSENKENKIKLAHKSKAIDKIEKWKSKYDAKIEKKGRDMTISAKVQKKMKAHIIEVDNGIDNALAEIAEKKRKKDTDKHKQDEPSDKLSNKTSLNSKELFQKNIFNILEEE